MGLVNVPASQVFLNSSALGWVEWKGIGLTVQGLGAGAFGRVLCDSEETQVQ